MGAFGSFTIEARQLSFVGHDLARPECVLSTRRGDLYVSDRRGGVTHVASDGCQSLIGGGDVVSNGIVLRQDGSFLLANLHGEGGVWRLSPDGSLQPFLMEVDGVALESVNFVKLDEGGRIWICANPPLGPDGRYRTEIADGFVAVVDAAGARVVADGIAGVNECLPHDGHLYVNETFGRRLTRFRIGPDSSLSARQVFAQFGPGTYPDGLGVDVEGGFWVVSIASNRLIRVDRDGARHVVLEDCDRAHLDRLEAAYLENRLKRADLTVPTGAILKNITSVAFGGADRCTVYLGSIASGRLASFRSPVAGVPPIHWNW